MCLLKHAGGAFTHRTEELKNHLSAKASDLVKAAFADVNAEGRTSLREIYGFNPLLFDFVLKRCLKLPGTNRRLPARVFQANPDLGV
jgi:hypothetical protein